MFIIPAGLNAGDAFYAMGVGNITIENVSVRDAAGVARTVVYAVAEDTHWYWDRATGVVVEARTANAFYTLDTIATGTGLWSPQILGLDLSVFFTAIILLAIGVIAFAVVLLVRRKGKTPKSST